MKKVKVMTSKTALLKAAAQTFFATAQARKDKGENPEPNEEEIASLMWHAFDVLEAVETSLDRIAAALEVLAAKAPDAQ